MRLSFVRDCRAVYLGGRSFGVGSFRVRWGGRWFLIEPITFINALGFASHVNSMGGEVILSEGPLGIPPQFARTLLPLLVSDYTPGRDDWYIDRSTDSQVTAALVEAGHVNGWESLREIVRPRKDEGPKPDDSMLDRALVAIGEKFGLWPHEVMRYPYVEVQAVLDAMAYNPDDKEPSQETADLVKRLSAEREARGA